MENLRAQRAALAKGTKLTEAAYHLLKARVDTLTGPAPSDLVDELREAVRTAYDGYPLGTGNLRNPITLLEWLLHAGFE